MAFPSLLKSPYVLGGVGVIGIGGISIASLSGRRGDGIDYSKFLQSEKSIQERNDFVKKDLLKNDRCFSEFFPNSKVSLKTIGLNPSGDSYTVKDPSSDLSNPSSPKACALVQYSYLREEAFIFRMEITIRNDKVGLALWVSGSNVLGETLDGQKIKSRDAKNIRYYLAFMEKAEGDKWSIKGGYSWYDGQFAYASKSLNLNVKIAGKSMYPHTNVFKGIAAEGPYEDEKWKHGVYFGRWNGGGRSGQEAFEGIEIWRDNKSSAEILGKDYSKTFDESKTGKGYSGVASVGEKYYEYVKPKSSPSNNEGWHYRSDQMPVSALDNWYKPFRGKKGTWVKAALQNSQN